MRASFSVVRTTCKSKHDGTTSRVLWGNFQYRYSEVHCAPCASLCAQCVPRVCEKSLRNTFTFTHTRSRHGENCEPGALEGRHAKDPTQERNTSDHHRGP
jgi:hypothetical protein